jgi:Domain of unknown function (DUF5615)
VLRWLADENFNNDILRALLRQYQNFDIVRAQDVGLAGSDDEVILQWAADQNRLLLTHDVSTITAAAYRRIMKGDPMPGVFEVNRGVPVRETQDGSSRFAVKVTGWGLHDKNPRARLRPEPFRAILRATDGSGGRPT